MSIGMFSAFSGTDLPGGGVVRSTAVVVGSAPFETVDLKLRSRMPPTRLLLAGLALVALVWTARDIRAVLAQLDRIDQRSSASAANVSTILNEVRLAGPGDLGNRRIDVRLFMIRSMLAQAQDPIVFLGDSITEAALLPSSICGRPVVNAGIGGTRADSYAELARSSILNGLQASLIVIALGTNDAATTSSGDFSASYRSLVDIVQPHTSKLVLVGVPPLGAGGLRNYFDGSKVEANSKAIRAIAEQSEIPFVDLASVFSGAIDTVDGVHLSATSYRIWMQAIASSVKAVLRCDEASAARHSAN
jgi:lysophospholipase L1-like esterase